MSEALGIDMRVTTKIGRWWFQRRSISPLPFFVLMIALRPDFSMSSTLACFAFVGVLVAESLRIWAVGFAGSATRTRGDTVAELVHAGPFRHVRNPLYIANILLYTSCAVAFGFIGLSVAIFLFSCVQYAFIVNFEEDTLQRTFGASYEEYRSRVPRWFASLVPRVESTAQSFSLVRAIRSEKSTLLSILFMSAAYTAKRIIIGM